MGCDSASARARSEVMDSSDNSSADLSDADTSRVKIEVKTHPLRWDNALNRPRLTAHIHPLRLVHSKYLYPFQDGHYICDIGKCREMGAGYVFNCPKCEFDICLECASRPCFTCTRSTCCHTQITIDMV